jgi:hypothetical protein
LTPGGSTTITIQVEPTGTFAEAVTLQISNAPVGLTVDLDRSTLSLPGEATLTVQDQSGGVLARHTQAQTVQITASGGGIEKTATLYLSVGEQPIVEQSFPFYLPLVTQP